jgi:membrane-bound ClpP family serine protease
MKSIALVVLAGIGAIVLGLFLMVPLGLLFDAMNWPLFHTFDLAHKSFFIAWPILAFFNLVLLRLLIRTWRLQRAEQ